MSPRKNEPKKPKGRITAYGYFKLAFREVLKKDYPDRIVDLTEFTKCCGLRWKVMSAEQKEPYQHHAELDKQRFNNEMMTYTGVVKEERGGKRKRVKDPNAPKRPFTAFIWFCLDKRPKVRAMYRHLKVVDVTKELGRMWANADLQTKEKYNIWAEKDKQRYLRQMEFFKVNKELVIRNPGLLFSVYSGHPALNTQVIRI